MYIKGALSVTNTDWRYVYNSVLNYFNQEIQIAYSLAINFYNLSKELPFNEVEASFNTFIKENKINEYQMHFIKSALFSGSNNKIYKPKKNNFKKINNRTNALSAGSFFIHFNKVSNSIDFETTTFNDLDNFIRENTFISEFITMVNTINWPTRPGPNKTVRGCTLINVKDTNVEIFYKVGSNPPEFNIKNISDTTLDEPSALQPEFIKNISMVSSTKEETSQPVPVISPEMSEF
jgi:hypothetical protein